MLMPDKGISTGWIGKISGFASVAAMVLLSLAYGTLMLGLITMALVGFAVKYWWLRRRLRSGGANRWRETVIEGEYRVLEQPDTERDGQVRR